MTHEERLKREELIREVRLSVYNCMIADSFETNNYDDMKTNEKMQIITLLHKIDKLDNKIAS